MPGVNLLQLILQVNTLVFHPKKLTLVFFSFLPGSARNKSDWRPMLELPPVTAAYYCCNFGYIVLGHSGKKALWPQICVVFFVWPKFLFHHDKYSCLNVPNYYLELYVPKKIVKHDHWDLTNLNYIHDFFLCEGHLSVQLLPWECEFQHWPKSLDATWLPDHAWKGGWVWWGCDDVAV